MGSAGIDDSSQKAIEPELLDVGNKLLGTPLSTDELLILLDVCGFMCLCVWVLRFLFLIDMKGLFVLKTLELCQ